MNPNHGSIMTIEPINLVSISIILLFITAIIAVFIAIIDIAEWNFISIATNEGIFTILNQCKTNIASGCAIGQVDSRGIFMNIAILAACRACVAHIIDTV